MIVERESELETMRQSLAAVVNTGGQLLLVRGEAGIGKSTFITAFLAQCDPQIETAVAWCDPLSTPRPLGPVRDLSAEILQKDLSEFGEADYFEGMVSFAQSSNTPLVLVIEDLHWVDQKSLDWIIFIGRRLSQLPILLIGSYRDEDIGNSHPLRTALASIPITRRTDITLAALSLEGVRRLGPHNSFSTDELFEITAGHPYFVTELLNSDSSVVAPPQSVSDVVNARFASLSVDLQRFLETLSCAPGDLTESLLQALPFDDIANLCDTALERRILVRSGPNLKFRHELARLAVFARLGSGRTREAHKIFLEIHLNQDVLEQELDMIVHHAEGAADTKATLHYAQQAAKNAAMFGAHREAALFLGSARACLDDVAPEVAAKVNEEWAYEAGLSLGIDDDVIVARERAIALWKQVDRPDRVGENLRWLSRLHWYRGESVKAETYVLQAIEILENEAPSSETGKAYALRAQFFMLQENMDEAVKWAERALDVATAMDDFDTQAHALNTIGSAKLFRGDLEGDALLRRSLKVSLAHEFHEHAARAYTNLSECLIELRAFDEAEALIEEGIAFDTAHDLDAWTYYLIGRKAQLRFEQDRYQDAVMIAQSGLEQPNQTLLMQLPARIILARAQMRLGHPDAENMLFEALDHAEQIDEPQYLVTVLVAHIEKAVLENDTEAAIPYLERLACMDPALFSPSKRSDYLFWAHLAGHKPNKKSDITSPFRMFLEGNFEKAAASFQQQGTTYLAAWSLTQLGSPTAFQKADALFEESNANAARHTLRSISTLPALATRHARGHYRAAREHPYELTAKEQVVLAMMADGKSNAVIAEELSRSRRTVENHVSAILSKLNCRNRVEVVLRSQSEPWILPEN